jgi:hypothetical protein
MMLRHVAPKWAGNKDLLCKHFLLGIGEAEGTGGAAYIWPSIEAAQHGALTERDADSKAHELAIT